MRFLGIDIGSSFIKGAVLDLDRIAIEHVVRRPFPEPLLGLPRLAISDSIPLDFLP